MVTIMSRVGLNPIQLSDKVKVQLDGQRLTAEGPLGTQEVLLPEGITVEIDNGVILVKREDDSKELKSLHGTFRALIANAVHGVEHGFQRELQLVGVGYRVKKEGNDLSFTLGYNHPVPLKVREGVEFEVPDETTIIVKGINKEVVNNMAAVIREMKKPEPYKGKGIRYKDEYVRRKTPKVAVAS